MKKRTCILLLLAIILIVISPFLFTRPAIWSFFSFTDTGQIGDTIGGITAPFVGLISIILLWLTLNAQRDFNEKQALDNKVMQILNMQSEIIHMDERIEFSYYDETCQKKEGHCSAGLVLLKKENDGAPYIEPAQAKYLFSQLKVFIALCNCYNNLLETEPKGLEQYIVFVSYYTVLLNDFLEQFEEGYIIVRGGVMDIVSDGNYVSELDSLRREAGKLRKQLIIKQEKDVLHR